MARLMRGVVEIARIDDDWFPAPLRFKGAQSRDEIVDGTVSLEQMHVGNAAEVALQGRRENDDGNFGTFLAQSFGDVGAELSAPRW